MKTKNFVILISIVSLMSMGFGAFAQRRVVHTPRRTVVQTPRGTVVYKKRPRVVTVRRPPAHAVVVHYHNSPYYYNSGIFYVPRNGVYVRIAPPVGITVASIPSSYIRIAVGPSVYFYAEGTFYLTNGSAGQYTVADPPVGAIVSRLPGGATAIEIDGQPYFEYNDIIYKSVYVKEPAYEVVGTLHD